MTTSRLLGAAAVCVGLAALPFVGLPAFYESFLYLCFSWIALATSWSILSGYTGYFSFGHGAFFGGGMYTTSTLAAAYGVPFLWTLPVAAAVAGLLALGVGAVVFRVRRLRGELFGLLTLAVGFVLATIVLNTRIDGGPGVYLSSVPMPKLAPTPNGSLYLLAFGLAIVAVGSAWLVGRSRLGLGLFAIHDDEDVAEVKGVPTFRYKLIAFALSSAIAGAAGGVHAMYVSYVTVAETFSITVPLYVVLMSVLGGARHWLGPAVGATIITSSTYLFTTGDRALFGRALVAFALIVVILVLPTGVLPALLRWFSRRAASVRVSTAAREIRSAPRAPRGPAVLECDGVAKAFGGIQALRSVALRVHAGEIVALVGPNGSGKTTLINVVSGHYRPDGGRIEIAGESLAQRDAHEIAQLGVARTYQIPRPFGGMRVLDNVAVAAAFGPAASDLRVARAEAERWLDFAGLGGRAPALPGELNLHERKFLELARALAARPRLIMLDEVLSGLNAAETASAMRLIREIRDRGAAILFVEHVIRAVVELSDRVVVLNEGEVIASGSPRDAMRDPRVVTAYLGKVHA